MHRTALSLQCDTLLILDHLHFVADTARKPLHTSRLGFQLCC